MTRVDSEGLEEMYTKIVGMGPDKVSTLWSAIEEVKKGAMLLKTWPRVTVGSRSRLHKCTTFSFSFRLRAPRFPGV